MNFRNALATSLVEESQPYAGEMLALLDIDVSAVEQFISGKASLTAKQIEILLTYLGYTLEKVTNV